MHAARFASIGRLVDLNSMTFNQGIIIIAAEPVPGQYMTVIIFAIPGIYKSTRFNGMAFRYRDRHLGVLLS